MGDVLLFPGAGVLPAPGPPAVLADMDAIGERYTALQEARARRNRRAARRLAAACADDVPALRDRIHHLEQLLIERDADHG